MQVRRPSAARCHVVWPAALLLAGLGQLAAADQRAAQVPADDRQRMLQLLVSADTSAAEVVREGKAVEATAKAAGDATLESLALSIQCRGLLRQGLAAPATQACARARELATGGDDLAVFAAERANGSLLLERGDPLAALPTLLDSNAAAVRSGDTVAVAASLMSLGSAAQLAGVNADAVDYYARALALSTRIGADHLTTRIANNLGVLLLESGDPEGALTQFQIAITAASRLDHGFQALPARYGLALAEVETGRPGDAIDRLRAQLVGSNRNETPAQHADGLLFLARAEYRLGNLAAAESAARSAMEQFHKLSPTRSYPAAALLADVLVASGKLAAAEQLSARLMREIPGNARGRVELLEARERMFAAQGRYRDAYYAAAAVRQARALQSDELSARTLAFLRVRSEAQQRLGELMQLRVERTRIDEEAARARIVRNFSLALLAFAVLGAFAVWGLARARRRLEAELDRRRSHEALAQLTGGVAHDFNTLMTIVQQTMHLLRSDASIGSNPGALRLIGEAEDAARLGGQITWQLLTFARQSPQHPEAIVLADFLAGRRVLFERALGTGMRLRLDIALSAEDGSVRLDPTQLTTCLLNLLTNARDAMSGAGEVVIRAESAVNGTRPNRWPELPAGRFITIAIVDTGCGMSAEVAQQATTPFFTTKGVSGGTGLGLSAVQGFAAQSGGLLQIESVAGQGSTVTLVVPSTRSAPHGTA